jgi:DedD protein
MADPIVENADFAVDELRRKARRRLVGAVVLALAAATLLPLLLEQDQKPLGDDVSVQIPPVDNAKFVSRIKGDGAVDASGKADAKAEAPKAGAKPEGKVDAAKVDVKSDPPKADTKAETPPPAAKSDAGANGIPAAPQPAMMAPPPASKAPATTAQAQPPAQPAPAPAQASAPATSKATPATAKSDATPAKAATKSDAEPKAAPKAEAPPAAPTASEPPPSAATTGATGTATASAPAAPAAPASAPAADAKPAAGEPAKSGGFSVQLGAFTDAYGANALVNKLKKQGYPAYTEPVETSRGTMYRVRVGGYSSREAAVEVRKKLKADGHDGLVQSAK